MPKLQDSNEILFAPVPRFTVTAGALATDGVLATAGVFAADRAFAKDGVLAVAVGILTATAGGLAAF